MSDLPPPQADRVARPASADGPRGLLADLEALRIDLAAAVHGRVELASLEAQRAALALVQMLVLGVVAAALALTAWLACSAGLIALLIGAGLSWPWSVAAAVILNLGIAWLLVRRARGLLRLVRFDATLRHLMPGT